MNLSVLRREKNLLTILFLSLIAVTQLSAYALQSGRSFSAKGTIVYQGIGAYTDAGCTEPLTEILWGSLHPGSSVVRTLYVRNESTDLKDVALLINVTGWSPVEASDHLTVTWNYDGQLIAPNMVIPLELTLSVSPLITVIEVFSFTITISAINP